MKVIRGEDSRVLKECVTCYACEEYCRRGNYPFISSASAEKRREGKGREYTPPPGP
jgi:heterodisulfide reductase subunit C